MSLQSTADQDRTAAQDRDAAEDFDFAALIESERPRALRIARRYGTDPEDAVQEANISAWKARQSFDPNRGSATNWYLTIVRNRAIDRYRRIPEAARFQGSDDDLIHEQDDSPSPGRVAEANEIARLVRSAVATLPGEQRQVLELTYFGGLSHSEAATKLGAPLGTIKGRIRLALQKLRDESSELLGLHDEFAVSLN